MSAHDQYTPPSRSFSEERVRGLPNLPEQCAFFDSTHQHSAVNEFTQRLRSLESVYTDVYSRVSALEKEIAKYTICHNTKKADDYSP